MRKIKTVLLFTVLLLGVAFLVSCDNTVKADSTYVTIDINPSIELIVSPKDKVVSVGALMKMLRYYYY